ncbi:MAG: GAF domain-containing protein [Pseudomonadota bacterium]
MTLSPETLYAELHRQTGGQLFTITVLERAAGLARRVYTSHPDTYPVSGTKPMAQGAWTDLVVEQGEVFVANTVAEFAVYFPDHAVIESLGCASALNVPVSKGLVIGTVNILDQEHYFSPQVVSHCLDAIKSRHDELVLALESHLS